jgi:hypothetical protein
VRMWARSTCSRAQRSPSMKDSDTSDPACMSSSSARVRWNVHSSCTAGAAACGVRQSRGSIVPLDCRRALFRVDTKGSKHGLVRSSHSHGSTT